MLTFAQSSRLARPLLRGIAAVSALATALTGRESIQLTGPWLFADSEAALNESPQQVTLPHDWSISLPRDSEQASSGGGGFFPTGIGWYSHTFEAPTGWIGQKAILRFEGVYQKASVWVNGTLLASHDYGYTPFQVDITKRIALGGQNEIVVKVDNSDQPNARWYTGSGIYRPVSLQIVDPVHIAPEGVSIATGHIAEDGMLGTVDVSASALNDGERPALITIKASIIDPDGLPVAQFEQAGPAEPGEKFTFAAKLGVPHPSIWDLATPQLYRLVVRSFVGERQTDRQETTFGIRTLELSAEDGLELNGRSIELIGANVHHDNGPLGAAEYRDAAFRKAKLLKDAGFNAVRAAHNPPSTDFLDACDHFGLLVIDEAFDGWKSKKVKHDYGTLFDANWEQDLRSMVLRDRNHPSVIMWSLGNEVYERGKESGIQIAADMRAVVLSIDTTRPVTAGINGLGKKEDWPKLDRLFSNFDAVGYNYELHRHADDHARLPQRVIYSSESYLDEAFSSWKSASDFNYVIGDFVWTGIDYLGEAGIGRVFPPDETARAHWEGSHYPWHGAYCGDIDLIGNRKPVSHYRNIVWNQGEKLYAAVLAPTETGADWNISQWATRPLLESWTWPNVKAGSPLTVEVYSRYPKVRLYLNGKKLAEKATGEKQEFKAVFEVPYKKGTLVAVGIENDQEIERFEIETARSASQIHLHAEDPIEHGETQRLRFIQASLVDSQGRQNPSATAAITFSIDGPARIAATGSAQLDSEEIYGANPRRTFQGKSLLVLELTGKGPITVTAKADGFPSKKLILK